MTVPVLSVISPYSLRPHGPAPLSMGFLRTNTLEWVAISPGGLLQSQESTCFSAWAGEFFTAELPREINTRDKASWLGKPVSSCAPAGPASWVLRGAPEAAAPGKPLPGRGRWARILLHHQGVCPPRFPRRSTVTP